MDLFKLTLRTHLDQALPAQPQAEPGTHLTCWPLRARGDRIDVTHTNRDYPGVTCALGPGPAAVERSVRSFRAAAPWDIQP